ncbi:MAG: malate:quinone oxidoreductase, partial [Spirochaetia bacterium]|nr:malate:quinone oxidoreductase [Spirochaetia bacterium]
ASTSVAVMLDVLSRCFPDRMNAKAWRKKIEKMIPSFGKALSNEPRLLAKIRAYTSDALALR